jgi:hypothetical protein
MCSAALFDAHSSHPPLSSPQVRIQLAGEGQKGAGASPLKIGREIIAKEGFGYLYKGSASHTQHRGTPARNVTAEFKFHLTSSLPLVCCLYVVSVPVSSVRPPTRPLVSVCSAR